jgi:hypothetical protein
MAGFLAAHGYDPGPTQRPLLSGALAGIAATAPAILILLAFGALEVEARILGLSPWATIAAGWAVMAGAGAAFARLVGRAANDKRGGWLIGMAYGFALWAAGAVMILPIASGGRAPAGTAALGLFLSLVLWGAALGALLPFIHRPLAKRLRQVAEREGSGPAAAAEKDRRRR